MNNEKLPTLDREVWEDLQSTDDYIDWLQEEVEKNLYHKVVSNVRLLNLLSLAKEHELFATQRKLEGLLALNGDTDGK